MLKRWLIAVVALLFGGAALAAPPDFDSRIAPVLASHCLDCHSGAEPKGALDLSQAERAMKGGENGAVIVPGAPEQSPLWQRVAADEMPPKKPLAKADKQVLREWVASGAKWGTDPIDPFSVTTSARAGYDWWSLQPVTRPVPPDVKGLALKPGALGSDIDRFVAERLESNSLMFSPEADRRTLIRRLSFDLIGLPPSPEEVAAFAGDESPQAYAKLVNRLLDSPHYAERWARHWLDVAHFGESDGFEYDRMRPQAWPYRDWVIEALNRDLPYDEFARLQIAGDVLRPEDAQAITAAGFLVHGAHDALMPAGDAMRQMMRQDELEDVVALVSQTFLGLTVNCARCHDHKFDPIKAEDYYRLASSLAGVRRGERPVPGQAVPDELRQRLTDLRAGLKRLDRAARERVLSKRGRETLGPEPIAPVMCWEFDSESDEVIALPLKLDNEARLEDGALVLNGKRSFAASSPIATEIHAKTLEAWVKLDNLDQRGGGVVTLQTLDGNTFDSIVFAERDAGQWMAGSENYKRWKSFAAAKESEAHLETVHLAVSYAEDGTITAYRNGELYGKAYKTEGPVRFKAGEAQVVLGMRHSPPGGNKMLAGRIERVAIYDRAITAEEVARSVASRGDVIRQAQILEAMTAEERTRRETIIAEIKPLDEKIARLASPVVYTIKPQQPEGPTHLLIRGNPLHEGDPIAPGGLSGLKRLPTSFELEPDAPEGERRKRLAEWVTRNDNPLFARTIANRVWHYHFGRGLVETPNDLGFSGGQASHPELLDYLAAELIESKWSLKHLHRLVVNSAVYRQASLPRQDCLAVDRDNRLLWRYAPRRLEAEAVRDAVLALAGELNLEMGGPSFHDFRPFDNHNSQYYEPIDPVGHAFHRRSIYRMWARGGKSPLLDALDCPDPSITSPKRGSTTTPLQALAMLNNSFMLRMADSMAARLERDAGNDVAKKVARAIELAYSRPPQADEQQLGLTFTKQHGLAAFCRVLLNSNGFLYVD